MNAKHFLFTLVTVIPLLITACDKKSDDDNDEGDGDVNEEFVMPVGEAAKILGKWQINTITINNHYSGTDHIESQTGTDGDYVDFRTDGKMHTFFKGNLDVSNYTVRGTKQITIDGDPAVVQVLSDTKLVLYSQDKTVTFGYTEITYDLKK